jgi:hypothetical protein
VQAGKKRVRAGVSELTMEEKAMKLTAKKNLGEETSTAVAAAME